MVFSLISTRLWDQAAEIPVATQRPEVTIHRESTAPETPRQTQRTQARILNYTLECPQRAGEQVNAGRS